ncbi:voltage-gated sodium channel alpha subunit [Striga asiatica]|uniref:Voltage-gated sodium channel alpha subunit n=1 Tax=Striga asiatica TaxID=4170 RepID=A0A5A7P2J0_STRAF|nr:voltage-gated sodium channel alpha subunit [Striga asiatica]
MFLAYRPPFSDKLPFTQSDHYPPVGDTHTKDRLKNGLSSIDHSLPSPPFISLTSSVSHSRRREGHLLRPSPPPAPRRPFGESAAHNLYLPPVASDRHLTPAQHSLTPTTTALSRRQQPLHYPTANSRHSPCRRITVSSCHCGDALATSPPFHSHIHPYQCRYSDCAVNRRWKTFNSHRKYDSKGWGRKEYGRLVGFVGDAGEEEGLCVVGKF